MKKNVLLLIKGFFVGVANIIPGVSGGTLAITLGIYENLLSCAGHFFKNFKKNIAFIIPVGIGGLMAIVLGSKALSFALTNYRLATILFFTGLILGGGPILFRKVKYNMKSVANWLIFLIVFAAIAILAFMNPSSNLVSLANLDILGYVKLFVVGVIAAATMIIPGISGSFVLMMLGYYEPILNTVKNITDFSLLGTNLTILIPFGIGLLVGIVILARMLEWLFKKYEVKTYCAVIGFVLSSMIAIFVPLWGVSYSIWELVIGLILAFIGFIIAYKIGEEK